MIAAQARDGVPDPVPRRLKQHLRGEVELTDAQVARAHQRLLRPGDRVTVLLGLLRAIIAAELSRAFTPAAVDDAVLHALQIVATIDDNRRILRRILQAHWRGEIDAVRRHPRTRAWWADHPEIPEAVWHADHRLDVPDPPLTLGLEADPIEVLRMGTAVGSCLGLGGILTHSAAAVAVDDNKRVVYARDRAGRVVARQLIALDDGGLLVCFAVYPSGTPPKLQAAFARFASRLARALGVEIYDGAQHGDYSVGLILASDGWDDEATGLGSARSPDHRG